MPARKITKMTWCDRHAPWFATCGTRARQIECMCEGGPGGWEPGCNGGTCQILPGTDTFYEASCHAPLDLEWTHAPDSHTLTN